MLEKNCREWFKIKDLKDEVAIKNLSGKVQDYLNKLHHFGYEVIGSVTSPTKYIKIKVFGLKEPIQIRISNHYPKKGNAYTYNIITEAKELADGNLVPRMTEDQFQNHLKNIDVFLAKYIKAPVKVGVFTF